MCTRQSYLVHTHLLQRLLSLIFNAVSLWYFFSYFSFAFLDGHSITSSSEEILVTSLYLDLIIWKVLVFFKSMTFFVKTLFQSFFKYSNYFLFSFFSMSILFSAFSHILASAAFLAFYTAYSIQWASAIFLSRLEAFVSLYIVAASLDATCYNLKTLE